MIQDITVDLRFSSPIGRINLPEVAQRADEISSKAVELSKESESLHRSNQGGWHSNSLLDSNEPIFQFVADQVKAGVKSVLRNIVGEEKSDKVSFSKLWVNVNEFGSWNTPHDHTTTWSGVLYVNGLIDRAPGGYNTGALTFWNPIAGVAQRGFPANVEISPAPGDLLLFPGYLLHGVAPHSGDSPRITFAFDFDQLHEVIR